MTASVVNCEAVGIACSAGGIPALRAVLSSLPHDFPVPILIVQHVDPHGPNMLANVINRASSLPVKTAEEGESIRSGNVYLAPPNFHLQITNEKTVHLSSTERIAYQRPSADVLFKSMADAYDGRLVAIVLTGMGSDGSAGIQAVKEAGGYVIAQDELTSAFFSMPRSAIQTGDVDEILPLNSISRHLVSIVCEN